MSQVYPIVEAHRGDSTNAPENTMAAFRRAVELGVVSIELDVHPSKDGTLMVMHDARLDRTSCGSGAISDMTTAELDALDVGTWFSAEYAGEKMPRLEDVFRLLAPTSIKLNIEIKSPPPGRDVVETVVSMLRSHGKEREYIVSSFDLDVFLDMQRIAPEVTLALIGKSPDILPLAKKHSIPWIHGKYDILSAEWVEQVHAEGLLLNAWLVDDAARLKTCLSLGVDKVCTNRPETIQRLLQEI